MHKLKNSQKGCTKALAAAALLMASSTVAVAGENSADDWQYGLLIVGWLPSISGDLNIDPPGGGGGLTVSADTILDALDMTFMGTFEARKGPWLGFTDVIYLKLSGDKSKSIPIGTEVADGSMSLKGWIWTLGGGYTLWQDQKSHFDLLAGARLLALDIDVSLTGIKKDHEVSESLRLWDAVIGVKGRYSFNDRWFMPYYLDVGTGDSKLTYQALAGIGYSFDWGDLMLNYRQIGYDQGSDKLLKDITFGGGELGVAFKF